MRVSIILFLFSVLQLGGIQHSNEQVPHPPEIAIPKLQIDKKTDSLKSKYYKAIDNRSISLDKLIEQKKIVEKENIKLRAEIKRLKKANAALMNKSALNKNIVYRNSTDTVYITDTVYKRRNIFDIFKKKKQ